MFLFTLLVIISTCLTSEHAHSSSGMSSCQASNDFITRPHFLHQFHTNHPPVYTAGRNSFEAAENIWEGVFGIVASIIITLMGAALLRVSKLQDKWRVKISKVLESKDSKLPVKGRVKRWMEKYAMFILPFVTVLREGIEAVL
jgi:hypothetical protein